MWTAHEREDLFGIFLRRGETLRVRACEEWTVWRDMEVGANGKGEEGSK